jgi:hypothetical protein
VLSLSKINHACELPGIQKEFYDENRKKHVDEGVHICNEAKNSENASAENENAKKFRYLRIATRSISIS